MGILEIRVFEGTNLSPKGNSGTSDPFCEFKLCPVGVYPHQLSFVPKTYRTRAFKKELDPQWQGERVLMDCSHPTKETLFMAVWDKNSLENIEMGTAVISLANIKEGSAVKIRAELRGSGGGSIRLVMSFYEQGSFTDTIFSGFIEKRAKLNAWRLLHGVLRSDGLYLYSNETRCHTKIFISDVANCLVRVDFEKSRDSLFGGGRINFFSITSPGNTKTYHFRTKLETETSSWIAHLQEKGALQQAVPPPGYKLTMRHEGSAAASEFQVQQPVNVKQTRVLPPPAQSPGKLSSPPPQPPGAPSKQTTSTPESPRKMPAPVNMPSKQAAPPRQNPAQVPASPTQVPGSPTPVPVSPIPVPASPILVPTSPTPAENQVRVISHPNSQPLPSGWEMRYDEDGCPYYVDHIHRLSTYEDPRLKPVEPDNVSGLPAGWEMKKDKLGNPYFVDHVNRTSTYKDPRGDSGRTPLPPGWEVRTDPDNKLYFVDHIRKITSYSDPRGMITGVDPLPPNWQVKVDTKGVPYFVDVQTQRTTYADPRKK
eukprot:TRINITY_DN2615_c0_g1_i2.p1 TRINITY_DN2615_c0_g1~~TRINITY_DN2615_c0_g1_i2.p1  ORF type:complete len:538 (-),score=77.39 TRINITY_DN2615_c0_g1_i2:37-1650(-)